MLAKIKNLLIITISGIYTAYSELFFTFTLFFKDLEIKQIHKKIEEEQLLLGKKISQNPQIKQEELDIYLKQIAFLQEEIDFLQEKIKHFRQEFLLNRKQKIEFLKGAI